MKSKTADYLSKLSKNLLQINKEIEVEGKAANQLLEETIKRVEEGIKCKDYGETTLTQGVVC